MCQLICAHLRLVGGSVPQAAQTLSDCCWPCVVALTVLDGDLSNRAYTLQSSYSRQGCQSTVLAGRKCNLQVAFSRQDGYSAKSAESFRDATWQAIFLRSVFAAVKPRVPTQGSGLPPVHDPCAAHNGKVGLSALSEPTGECSAWR